MLHASILADRSADDGSAVLVVPELGDLDAEVALREGEEAGHLVLPQLHAAVAVGVGGAHAAPRLPPREPHVEAPQRVPQLLPADPPVAVRVELRQPRPELLRC
jgi:hypothetical protein|uniref:Uncharacterized protein n=1 Tax=Zea mays TaxID=4577 RepID=C4J612_MAIZE|nr:unknown [Zea mays]